MSTKIAWATETWNPLVGCTRVSDGCRNCYASALHNRRYKANVRATMAAGYVHGGGRNKGKPCAETSWAREHTPDVLPFPVQYDHPFATVQTFPERLDAPLHWRKPRRVFVNSMSDLFHEDVPDEFICRVFGTMAAAQRHTFQVLTKRPARMRELLSDVGFANDIAVFAKWDSPVLPWPLPNVWLGVSVEDQNAADRRIGELLEAPAAVRFISAEPLLGHIDFRTVGAYEIMGGAYKPDKVIARWGQNVLAQDAQSVDWVIVGGESGANRRPMDLAWARSIVQQCKVEGVPVFVKQDSAYKPGVVDTLPATLRIQELPEAQV